MTATITLYCDHHDESRRGCLAQYSSDTAEQFAALLDAEKHGWRQDSNFRHYCPKHAKEAA